MAVAQRRQGQYLQARRQSGQRARANTLATAAAPAATQTSGGNRLQALANFTGAATAMGFAPQQTQAILNRRYGQQQGMGQGYRPPRRSLGGGGMTGYERTRYGQGYSPRVAGMFGGRPSYGTAGQYPQTQMGYGQTQTGYYPQYAGQGQIYGYQQPQYAQQSMMYPQGQSAYGQMQPQMLYGGGYAGNYGGYGNQMGAMTDYAFPARTYVQQPWGGNQAVPRQRMLWGWGS